MGETMFTEKILRLIQVAGELKPGVAHIEVKHDDDCPAIKTQSLADCTCYPVFKGVTPEGNGSGQKR